jgi:hypothetical protein
MGSATANAAATAGDDHGLPLEQLGFEDRVEGHGNGPLSK